MEINSKDIENDSKFEIGEIRPFGCYVPRRYILAVLTFLALMFATIIKYVFLCNFLLLTI